MQKNIELTTEQNGNLRFTLTNEGKQELEDLMQDQSKSPDEIFIDLLEYNLCNGELTQVYAEEVGALTESLIFSTDYKYKDDSSEERIFNNVFWFPEYCLKLETEELKEKGFVIYTKDK